MARFLILCLCAFMCGIVGERVPANDFPCGAYLACAGILYLCLFTKHRLCRRGAAVLLAAALGAATSSLDTCVRPDHLSNFCLDNGDCSLYTVQGTVIDIGTPKHPQCIMALTSLSSGEEAHVCTGEMSVVPVPKIPVHCGQRICVQGHISRLYKRARAFGARNPPRFTVSSLPPGKAQAVADAGRYSPVRIRGALKWKTARLIETYLSPVSAGILEALILGERADFPAFITSSLTRTGTIHIVSISGFHIGLIGYLLTQLLKICGIARRWRGVVIVPLLVFYCGLTGATSPVARSTIMGILFVGAFSLGKEPDTLHALTLAALCLLAVDPGALFSTSFQLSFMSVLSIVLLYPRFAGLIPGQWISARRVRPVKVILNGVFVSLSAWIGTAPIVARVFNIVTPVTLLANIAIVPLSALLMCAGIVFIAAGFILPCAAGACAASVEAAVALLLHANAAFANLPGAYFYLSRR